MTDRSINPKPGTTSQLAANKQESARAANTLTPNTLHYSTLQQIPTEFSLRTSIAPLVLADEVRRILEAPPASVLLESA